MSTSPKPANKVNINTSNKSTAAAPEHALHHLAFENSLQANIITTVSTGKIISANSAACKLLGYSRKELLTRNRTAIFNINEKAFKDMLKQRTAEGKSAALVTAIKKNGKPLTCEITSSVFMDNDGIDQGITTIADMSQSILRQKQIDYKKEKIVANNIVLAKSKQKGIDTEQKKIVANNIVIAKSKQKGIDTEQKKIVANNIVIAKSKQKGIDTEQKKIVANNIVIAKSKQKGIDTQKKKIVAENIVLAKSKQKGIDIQKKQIVVENIGLARSRQKGIDIRKEKIVANNIDLAKTKQKGIDKKNKKLVAHNIVLAKSKQKEIDSIKEKIVTENIIIAKTKSDSAQLENRRWKKSIGKMAYDVMWDWDIDTGEIYVSDSIEEVFGYKVENNKANFTDFTQRLLTVEKDKVEKKLFKALASAKSSWNDAFCFIRQDGTVASTTCRAKIIRDKKGRALRLIGALLDVSPIKNLEQKLEAQNSIQEQHKFLLASKLSFDVIWDWNILTNEVFIGEGYEELFGYLIKNNKGSLADWGNHIHPEDKEAFETGLHEAIESAAVHWEHTYRYIRADGSIAKVFDRASIIRHAGGRAYRMIGAMRDLTRQKALEEKLDQEIATKGKLLTDYKESFKLIFNSSSDVLYDRNLAENEIIISDAFEKEFGYKITTNMTAEADWESHIHPDDKERVMTDYYRMIASEEIEWKCNYRFLRADGSVANIVGSSIILRNAFGKAFRMIGSMQDISKQVVLEEKLEQEIKLKEKQIAEATQDAKDSERSDIGKELHDNINQLLGVSRMYLQMAKKGGENSEMYVGRSSEYTLLAIEEVRKLSKGLTTDVISNIGLCQAVENLIHDTMEVNPVIISCMLKSFKENSVNDKFKLNIFRIVQEHLNNILKHSGAKEVTLSLSQNKKSITLYISDNGVGFDTEKKRKGIGVDNIKSRAASYKGFADFVSQPGRGCVLTVSFPVKEPTLKLA